jgi:hypothetical protein
MDIGAHTFSSSSVNFLNRRKCVLRQAKEPNQASLGEFNFQGFYQQQLHIGWRVP